MKNTYKLFLIFIILCLVLAGCRGINYDKNIQAEDEYPAELFPIYNDAVVYNYEFENGIIDVTFGSQDEYEDVYSYYDMLLNHHSYDITMDKKTTQKYISAGKIDGYTFLLEAEKAIYRKEKKYYNTVVKIRIEIDDFYAENLFVITPTPQALDKPTPEPTSANTEAPQATSAPTPYTYADKDVIATIDMQEEEIFIECLGVDEQINKEVKEVAILLKVLNYGQKETGYISHLDFEVLDIEGNAYYCDMLEGIFAGGTSLLPGGYCVDYISFKVPADAVINKLSMPDSIGSRTSKAYTMELAPISPPADAGKYDVYIAKEYDIGTIPTFIIGQQYLFDKVLQVKLNDARYFINHTSENQDNLMYTYTLEFTNTSTNVIIPVEMRDFVLFDTKHNIYVKPTIALTPYDELAFKPVQSGVSKVYNLSFEIFEDTNESNLCLLLYSANLQSNRVIYKIR